MNARLASLIVTLILMAGLLWWMILPAGHADVLLMSGLLALMTMPISQLVGAIAEEVRAREWGFAAIGVGVLLLLSVSALLAFRP